LQRRTKGDWEIDYSELEMGEQLGTGGYGEVNKAMWKGTEVAVKMMVASSITKDMERDFRDEVYTPSLRRAHPLPHTVSLKTHNYMCACTTGEGDDRAQAPQRGAVHGRMHQAAQDVHRHGVHVSRLALRRTRSPTTYARVTAPHSSVFAFPLHQQLLHNELIPEIPFQLKVL
jgi:serine/threonine protein kinase